MAKNAKKYDFVVVGDSLLAVLTAVENARGGAKGALMTGSESVGGLHRGMSVKESTETTSEDSPATTRVLDSYLNYLPDDENVTAFLAAIKVYVPELEWQSLELGPFILQNGVTQPFLGFGSHAVEAVDFYTHYTNPRQLQLNMTLASLVQALLARFSGDVFTAHEITALDMIDSVAHIQTNGSDTYQAARVYVCESPAKLTKVLPSESQAFGKAPVQRLSKANLWTAISLSYVHNSAQTETNAIHVLYGAKDVPSVGAFRHIDGKYMSHWISILSSENMADTEQLGVTIREMKKQIKRMYPHFTDSVEKEFIMVAPDSFGRVPAQVCDNPDVFKNHTVFVGGQHYTSFVGMAGEARSFIELRSHFQTPVGSDVEQSPAPAAP